MTKNELIDAVYEAVALPGLNKKATGQIIDSLFDALKGGIKEDGRFSFPGFGTFTVKERAARMGRNPHSNQPMEIPASKSVGFKPAPAFKETL
jgi:DNA-binding protein HU-beta